MMYFSAVSPRQRRSTTKPPISNSYRLERGNPLGVITAFVLEVLCAFVLCSFSAESKNAQTPVVMGGASKLMSGNVKF